MCALLPDQVCSHCFEPDVFQNCNRCDAVICDDCVGALDHGGCHSCDEMLCSRCAKTAEFKRCQPCGMFAFTVTTCELRTRNSAKHIMLNTTFVLSTGGFSCRECRVNCKICFEAKFSISCDEGNPLEMLQDHLHNLCPNPQCTLSCGIYRSIYIDYQKKKSFRNKCTRKMPIYFINTISI